MKFAINQATTMKTDFAKDIEAYSNAGFTAIEIWLPKLKEYLGKGGSLSDVKKMLGNSGLKPIGACYQAGLMFPSGKTKKEVMKEFSENLEICGHLEIPVLIVPADNISPVEDRHYYEAAGNLVEACEYAEKFSVKLAIEFLARARFLGCLSTAAILARKMQRENAGILFDTFHFYCGISKIEDIDGIQGKEILLVHLKDVAEKPREIMTDKDRVLPGDGIIPLEKIIGELQKIGYDGYYSLELFNEELWSQDPYKVAKKCFENLGKLRRKL
ncbi:MAG: sugar phosphate isomerase/epimerase [Candidatus Omnitrophica bacterium]|nr:sugar phosphate isomerase/epimerase [Candidatus Omnitrophota bacterium]